MKTQVSISLLLIFTILILFSLISCNTEGEGCTDPNSPNYNPNATISGSCDYPSQTKKVVCFYFNDSDNGTCGSFGMNLLDQVEATNPANSYFITVHPNGTDTLFCPAAINIATADSVGGFPDFGVGEQSGLLTQLTILNAISTEMAETAQGGVNVDFSVSADSIHMVIFGKFYVNDASTYFASAYVLEDNIVSPQAGASGSYNHKHVLRAASGPSGIGDQINTLPVSNASSFKLERAVVRNPVWNMSNISVVAVLWRQNGSDFEYVNAGD